MIDVTDIGTRLTPDEMLSQLVEAVMSFQDSRAFWSCEVVILPVIGFP